jgi:hypothetical protein
MLKNANFHRIIKVNNLPEIVYRKTMSDGTWGIQNRCDTGQGFTNG